MQRKWLTVSKNNPCVRCARFDWCALSADGKIVVCRRDDSGGIHKTDSSGADYWVYATDDALDIQTVVLPQLPDKEERTRAAPVDLDRVYRALLDRLTLSDYHLEQLRGRGLSDAAIKRRLYRTMPRNGRPKIAQAMAEEFASSLLSTVPGFYTEDDRIKLGGDRGLLIPSRDVEDLIVGLMVRLDDPGDGPKYHHVSSYRHGGPSAGSLAHLATIPDAANVSQADPSRVRVTEGHLKGDVAAELSAVMGLDTVTTVSISGVAMWRAALPILKALEAETVVLSYDADAWDNRNVARSLINAVEGYRGKGFTVEMEAWDRAHGKGIDDVLHAVMSGNVMLPPGILVGDEVDTRVNKIVTSATETDLTPAQRQLLQTTNLAWGFANAAAEDIGAPFEPLALGIFAQLQQDSGPDWQRVRDHMKSAGVRMVDLDANISKIKPSQNGTEPDDEGPEPDKFKDDEGGLPLIQVSERWMWEITADALEVLTQVNKGNPTLFNSGGAIVMVTKSGDSVTSATLTPAILKGKLDRNARFFRWKDRRRVPARPPDDVCTDLLVLPDLPFPKLTGISETPLVLPTGEILLKSGYNEESGYYVNLNGLSASRSDMPLDEALHWLQVELFGDFPFVDKASATHALSFVLQPFLMALIDAIAPCYLVEAPTAGMGKGLIVECVSIITLGHTVATQGVTDDDEFRKSIFASLLEGTPMIWIDNAEVLMSSNLARIMTSRTIRDRIMRTSKMGTAINNVTWAATGNNVLMDKEMARRMVPVRIDAGVENPDERTEWRHENLREFVQEHRIDLVSACLSVINAWIKEGMPLWKSRTIGSFERWAKVMGGVLDVAGVPDFLANRGVARTYADPISEEWSELCRIWWNTHRGETIRAGDVFAMAKANELLLDIWAGVSHQAASQAFGGALTKQRDRVYGSRKINQTVGLTRRNSRGYYLTDARDDNAQDEDW